MAASPVVHLELYSCNAGRACSFYERLLGWRAEAVQVPAGRYVSMALGNGLDGGVVEVEGDRSLWLPYVAVEDVHETTRRAGQLGARVLLAPREGPAGWRSVVKAPGAGGIALWQPKSAIPPHP